MKKFYLFNSVKKEKTLFEPINKKDVRIYVCGPTVYDDAHLGHARSAIVFDLLHRVLKTNGYKVIMAKNFTDIDDKIIKKIKQSGKNLEDITQYYINSYKNDMNSLNILENTIEPKATQNIDVMINIIEKLQKKDIAYIIEDGVYFDTSKDKSYGTISHKTNNKDLQARVEENNKKRNTKDFALWKFQKDKNEIAYDSPFGRGRPGWHIECSAMIDKHLAYKNSDYSIDIHGGGSDLLFPHHENEAAQTRCFSNQHLAKYWMHNGFVNIDGEKMSKSLGNSFFVKDLLKLYNGEVIRFYLLSVYYRSDFNFNEEDLSSSKKRLDKIYRVKKRVYNIKKSTVNKEFKENIQEALNDDLNTSKALSIIDEMITKANDVLTKEPKNKLFKEELVSNIEFIQEILGIANINAYKYFQFGISKEEIEKIENLIQQRAKAKENKNFKKADEIRCELEKLNISIMDTHEGVVWEKL